MIAIVGNNIIFSRCISRVLEYYFPENQVKVLPDRNIRNVDGILDFLKDNQKNWNSVLIHAEFQILKSDYPSDYGGLELYFKMNLRLDPFKPVIMGFSTLSQLRSHYKERLPDTKLFDYVQMPFLIPRLIESIKQTEGGIQ